VEICDTFCSEVGEEAAIEGVESSEKLAMRSGGAAEDGTAARRRIAEVRQAPLTKEAWHGFGLSVGADRG